MYLALRDGPRGFGQDSSCPALLRWLPCNVLVACTCVSHSARRLSMRFQFLDVIPWELLRPRTALELHGLGSDPFDRLYSGYRCFFLFLRVLRCFSSPRSPRQIAGDRPSACRVAPFGHSRITSCLRIPVNFRSLPRPSSPPDSLGIPRSPFSSFSRELQSLNTVAHRIQRLSSCLVFAYEIAVPNSQLEKTLE